MKGKYRIWYKEGDIRNTETYCGIAYADSASKALDSFIAQSDLRDQRIVVGIEQMYWPSKGAGGRGEW